MKALIMRNKLEHNRTLCAPESFLVSSNGQNTLEIDTNGNLAIYRVNRVATWSTTTSGQNAYLILQQDGNLVLYSQGQAIWATGTTSGHQVVLHDDGQLVMYDVAGQKVWTSSSDVRPIQDTQIAFDRVYNDSVWGVKNGTKSGDGSTESVNRTRNLFLAFVINRLGVTDVYDICGDCNWQRRFMRMLPEVTYFGMDVSTVALQRTQIQGRLLPNMFVNCHSFDVSKECCHVRVPSRSLFLVKEVIQHLPLATGLQLLQNIKKAGVKYLAITHHDCRLFENAGNTEVETGGFYANDMFRPPFNFHSPLFDVADFLSDDKMTSMGNLLVFDLQIQPI